MIDIKLTGLDGTNPLGFLAALGIMEALADSKHPAPRVEISWTNDGTWHPVLRTEANREQLIATLDADRQSFAGEPSLHRMKYPKSKGGKEAWDLKPAPEEFRRLLRELSPSSSRRTLAYLGSFGSEVITDNNGNLKPTALHFTAGQQEFLEMVAELSRSVTPADFEEALFGPWRYERNLPVLQWDSTSSRDYALRATDPSTDKKAGVPGADWLAFRALPFFPVAPVRGRLVTTCFDGHWKTGRFRWPLWTRYLTLRAVRTALVSWALWDDDLGGQSVEFAARGFGLVLECGVRRSDQGGYGSFTPARVLARP